MGLFRRTQPEPAPKVRPRYGTVTHKDGTTRPVVFHPTDDPNVFVGLDAATETPVVLQSGDRLSVDVIGAGQSVVFDRADP
jgi:hypothetical protein